MLGDDFMKTLRTLGLLPLLAALALGACDNSDPAAVLDEEMSFEDEIALAVIADPASIQAALDLVDAGQGAQQRHGMGRGMGPGTNAAIDALREQARMHFEGAQAAYHAGDRQLALEQARMGRNGVAQAMEISGGHRAIDGMVERMESMSNTVPADPLLYQDAQALGFELGMLAQSARGALNRGDRQGAGECGVLAEQRTWQGHRNFHGGQGEPDGEHVRLAVELSATAAALAERILTEQGSDEEQDAFLAAAKEFQARAEAALAAGELRNAAHFSGLGSWNALKSLVLPGGITDDELRAMIDLATEQYVAAVAAVGSEPTELQAALLERARHMLENGEEHVLAGNVRGVGALWRSAVISTWLIG